MSSEIAAELPAGTNEVAHVAAWVFLQVILVVLLSLPERPCRADLGHDLPGQRPDASTSAMVSTAVSRCSSLV